jgi:uncharacterized membrane protein (DUF485 family)
MAKRHRTKGKDLTPFSGSPTDVARLGRGQKPFHERTAKEEMGHVPWDRLAQSPDFKELVARKRAFIIPACVFFILYYFALPVLVGFAPEFMATPVLGKVNLAYLFALSQFFMAWILAGLYVRLANHTDVKARSVMAHGMKKGGR